MNDWEKLLLIKECLKLPDGSKLKAGTYKSAPPEPPFQIFERSVNWGYAPSDWGRKLDIKWK